MNLLKVWQNFPQETVSQFVIKSFRSEARNLVFNKYSVLRFLTCVRNDTFSNYDTVSRVGMRIARDALDARGHGLPRMHQMASLKKQKRFLW
jgi:hypothetical protein